jgi:hypothetical protein
VTDATFEDGAYSDQPLRLGAESPEDLEVVSSLVQDAVGIAKEISWMPRRRRLVMLLNRFRWEDKTAAEREGRAFERVRTALMFDDVSGVRAMGLPVGEPETVYAILATVFEAGDDGTGKIVMTLAGDGMLALDVECINVRLTDLTRPWEARGMPAHETDGES